jgi:surfeit locus 1 family protein
VTPGVRRLLWPAVMTSVMLIVLIGLGTWQVQRLHWKEEVLARIARAEASAPIPLGAAPLPYAKVETTGHLRADLTVLVGAEVRETPKGPKMGAHLIEPLERDGAPPLLVDRGWVPLTPTGPLDLPAEPVRLTGFVHPPEAPGWFSATDNTAERHFYTLDPVAIGAALRLNGTEPFVLVVLGPKPATRWPEPAQHLPRPPNNHLTYVITWYGLAAALVAIFTIYARKGSKHDSV